MQANRAILFADIEGSVQLFRQLGDEKALALIEASHRATRTAIDARGGRFIKGIGDGLMASFADAASASEAAIFSQQAMGGIGAEMDTLRLCIGIHAGSVIETEDDCFGDTVNIASRLSAVASGGEIVLSARAAEDLPPHLLPMIRRLGGIALKGVSESFHVCEILWSREGTETVLPYGLAQMGEPPGPVRLDLALAGRRWRSLFESAKVTIGRNETSRFPILDPRASRDHASIQLVGEQWVLTDHSTNGTFVSFADEEAIMLRRHELVLRGMGTIGFGFDPTKEAVEALRFNVFTES